MSDMDKDTVDFQLNFDDTLEEPTVLPTRIPTCWSTVPPGSLWAWPPICRLTIFQIPWMPSMAYIDNRDIEIPELTDIIKAPDFPTGGIIYGYKGVREAYETGRGKYCGQRPKPRLRSPIRAGRRSLLPRSLYLVNKAEMIRKTADLINEKKIEGNLLHQR
jgi:DNA gyrase subunit A